MVQRLLPGFADWMNRRKSSFLSAADKFKKDYEALSAEHTRLSEKIRAIAEQKKDKAERRRRIEIFLHMLEEQKECADFEQGMFVALVDKVIIQHDGHMGFCFRNGMKCEYPQ